MGYDDDEGLVLVDFSESDQDWLKDIGALEEGVDPCGNGTNRKRMDVKALRRALKKAFPTAENADDYADGIDLMTGNVPVSGTAILSGIDAMSTLETASFAQELASVLSGSTAAMASLASALISSEAGNSVRTGTDGLIYENDANP